MPRTYKQKIAQTKKNNPNTKNKITINMDPSVQSHRIIIKPKNLKTIKDFKQIQTFSNSNSQRIRALFEKTNSKHPVQTYAKNMSTTEISQNYNQNQKHKNLLQALDNVFSGFFKIFHNFHHTLLHVEGSKREVFYQHPRAFARKLG